MSVIETSGLALAAESAWVHELLARYGAKAYPVSRYDYDRNGSRLPIGDTLRTLYDARRAACDANHAAWEAYRAEQRAAHA